MNSMNSPEDLEDRLCGLLAGAAADPPNNPQRLRQVHSRASRRRRNRMMAATGSVAVVVLAAAMTSTVLGRAQRPSEAPSMADPATRTAGAATVPGTPAPKGGTEAKSSGHYAALFSVPNTTLSTSLAITYGTGAGTKQVTIPDGSEIGVIELKCEGQGAIGVDDHGALGGAIPVPQRPSTRNCGQGQGTEADLVAEKTRSGPNGVVAPGMPVTLTIRTTGNARWWLVVGRVGGQSRSGLPNPDQLTLGPAPAVQDLAGRTTAAGLFYQCGEVEEKVRVALSVSGTPVDASVTCAAPGETHVLTFATPLHLTAPIRHPVIRRVGSKSPPADYSASILTPSGLAVWSKIPGVVHGTLTP